MSVPNRISIIWPYWQRGEAMLRGAESMLSHYEHDDAEIVVVDDGSPTDRARDAIDRLGAFGGKLGPEGGLKIRLVELPIKPGPLNPCVPINRGVAASTGEFILLTNPETTHRAPILSQMRETIEQHGRDTYVHAGVFCPQSGGWHTHSEYARAGYHFCAMLHRSLWDKIGGFDEDFRPGYCYDDPDFVQRVIRAGGKFFFRDDLVADHHQTENAKHWRPREDWDRNKALYEAKWPNPRSHDGVTLTHAMIQNWPGAQ